MGIRELNTRRVRHALRRCAALIGLFLLVVACTQAPGQQPSSPSSSPTESQEDAGETSNADTLSVGAVGTMAVASMAANLLTEAYAKEAIDLEIIEHRGATEAMQAFSKGSLSIYLGDITQATQLAQQGQPVKIIASAVESNVYSLVGRPGSSTDVKALKGKIVGVTTLGGLGDTSLRWLLKTNGLDPSKDVTVSALASDTALLDALQANKVYAAITSDPETSHLTSQAYVVIYDFGSQVKPFNAGVLMAKEPWLKEHADLARRFLRATFSATKQLAADDKTRDNVYQQVFDSIEPEVAMLAGRRMHGAWSTTGKVTEASLRAPFELDKLASGLDKSIPALKQLIDESYLP